MSITTIIFKEEDFNKRFWLHGWSEVYLIYKLGLNLQSAFAIHESQKAIWVQRAKL